MSASSRIEKLINSRLQFLQSLFQLSSFQDIIVTNDVKLVQQHEKMQKQQTQAVSNLLSTVRIDQIFKKQFHKIVLKIFKKIQPRINIRSIPTGSYKDILADYTSFFNQLKQKNILDFLREIFQLHIYNQTTIIYVLLELLLKFLRIKCKTYIDDRIIKVKQKTNRFDHFSEFMKFGHKVQLRNSLSNKKRNGSQMSKQSQKSIYLTSKQDNGLNLKFHSVKYSQYSQTLSVQKQRKGNYTRRMLRSASFKKQIIHTSRIDSQKPQRRIIKSYKDILQQTKEKIQKSNQNLINAVKQFCQGPSQQQLYYKLFTMTFKQQWQTYINLTGIVDVMNFQNIQRKKSEDESYLKVSQIPFSKNRKAIWLIKNKDKVIVEACARNDQIRKQMEQYTEKYKKI